MVRSGQKLGVRIAVMGLFCVVVMAYAERPAMGGCHAPQKPTLGFAFGGVKERFSLGTLDHNRRVAPAFAPIPCSGELPGSSAPALPSHPATTTSVERFAPDSPGTCLVCQQTGFVQVVCHASIDRPPRHTFRPAGL